MKARLNTIFVEGELMFTFSIKVGKSWKAFKTNYPTLADAKNAGNKWAEQADKRLKWQA